MVFNKREKISFLKGEHINRASKHKWILYFILMNMNFKVSKSKITYPFSQVEVYIIIVSYAEVLNIRANIYSAFAVR